MEQISILSVNISEIKGTVKKPVDFIVLNQSGIEGDAHAGRWHRQVSLLGTESLNKMQQAAGRKLNFGEFAENITTQGYLLYPDATLRQADFRGGSFGGYPDRQEVSW